jgi:hypothetical protein
MQSQPDISQRSRHRPIDTKSSITSIIRSRLSLTLITWQTWAKVGNQRANEQWWEETFRLLNEKLNQRFENDRIGIVNNTLRTFDRDDDFDFTLSNYEVEAIGRALRNNTSLERMTLPSINQNSPSACGVLFDGIMQSQLKEISVSATEEISSGPTLDFLQSLSRSLAL